MEEQKNKVEPIAKTDQPKLKLNYKRTFFMGFAFFAILMLWQMYNQYCPKFLRELLGEDKEYLIGMIMAADNFFAIFMLPLFGALSDKTKSKWGRRMPYIVVGMILSIIVFPFIAVMYYLNNLVGLIIMMGLTLLIMNMYRNPAVALTPDVTPKPLRSQANGIINLVGYIGAICGGAIALLFGIIFKNNLAKQGIAAFIVTSFFMLLALILLIINIKENKIVEEMKDEMALGETMSESFTDLSEDNPLTKKDKINLWIMLASVLFWYISFNAVESFYSLFCEEIYGPGSIQSFIIMAGLPLSSVLTFLFTINLPAKIGRKNSVLIGLISIIVGFGIIVLLGIFQKDHYNSIVFIGGVIISGIGWALINANSYPMLVEMSNKSNVGKFTGYYYTFSMIAQTVTPVLVGAIIAKTNYKALFIYSLITMVIALIIFSFFKEKRVKIEKKKGFDKFDE